MTGIAGVIFPYQAQGSLIERDGKVVGSALIGQEFTSDALFPRPSVRHGCARPEQFDQDRSGPLQRGEFRRLESGPTNKALIERVQGDVDKLKQENPSAPVPIDLVTTTGSGLDPDISPAAALFQVPRVAKARNMPEDRVRQLVDEHVEGRTLGFLGEPRVNVLALNLALDRAAARERDRDVLVRNRLYWPRYRPEHLPGRMILPERSATSLDHAGTAEHLIPDGGSAARL